MFNENNITEYITRDECIHILTESAETIAGCGREIQEAAENIILSCQIPGAKADANRDMLVSKAEDLERIAALYNSASMKLMNASEKLAEGAEEDKVMSDVLAYNTFFKDQLKSEELDINNILSLIREDCHDN